MSKLLILFLFTFLFSQAEITNIQASQRTDGSQIVDITYDLLPDPIFEFFEIEVKVSINGGDTFYPIQFASGDLGELIESGNEKSIIWEFGNQFNQTYSEQIKIKIEAISYAITDNNNNQELPFEMITIPAGPYTSGENNEMLSIDYDYEIMKYEVTDLDYVLFMLDKLNDQGGQEWWEFELDQGFCGDGQLECLTGNQCINGSFYCDGSNQWGTGNWGPDCNDGSDELPIVCCAIGSGPYNGEEICDEVADLSYVGLSSDGLDGYYPGDAINPAGIYRYITFNNSKISWNGEIFEVEEGHVNHPVTGVTWFGAWAFATHYGMQVPTNDEWEKAARGDSGYNYPFGDDMTYQMANFNSDLLSWNLFDVGSHNTTPVGMYDGRILDIDCTVLGEEVYDECLNDYTHYGAENCDSAWETFNINCATLQSVYNWDCIGCECPGDGDGWTESAEHCLSFFPDGIFITIDSPSAYGLYDMAGNVSEIVHNGNESQYYAMGGHWNSSLIDCQSWQKGTINAIDHSDQRGFRCLRRTTDRSSQENSNKKKEKIINQNKMIEQLKKVKN
jgi:formylglycine-generating enzyme required for sulfatase activity